MKRFLSVLLALMMIFSTAIFAAPTMVSTADTSAEAVEEVGAETQAVVLDESTPTDYDENYGYLVASMDFDNVEVGTEFAIGGLHSITTNNLGVISDTIPEDLGLSKNFYLHIGGYGSGNWKATVEGDDSNKYLTLSVVSNDKTAGLGAGAEIGRRTVLISTDHNTNSLLPEGEYTLVFDQKHDATRSKNTNTMNSPIRACNWIGYLNEYYGINNPETYTTLADGTSRCVAVANKPHDESFTGYLAFGPAPAPGLVGANGSDFAWYRTYDNFKLYYKPSVEVTFDSGDVENATFVGADNTTIQAIGSINLSDYHFTTTDMKVFKGWKDENGNALSGTINLIRDMVLTADWEDAVDAKYGYLVASMDFDNVEVGTEFAIGLSKLHSITTNNLGVISDKIPADLGLSKNFHMVIGGYGSGWKATVEGDDSNKYLTLSVVSNDDTASLTNGAEIGRRYVTISTDLNANSLLPEGEYTLIFDEKDDATRSKNTTTHNSPIRAFNWNGEVNEYNSVNNPETYTTLADGTRHYVAIANRPLSESFTGYLGFGPAPAPGLVGDNGSDFAWYRTYDNFKLYYKPFVNI